MAWIEAKQTAEAILDGFNLHYRLFLNVTAEAKQRFEDADWSAAQALAKERILFYDKRVSETVSVLRRELDLRDPDQRLWQRVKTEYLRLLPMHKQPELAETFYNSVFCRLFHRSYYNNSNIFVWPAMSTEHLEAEVPIYRCYYPARDGFAEVICRILADFHFRVPYANRRSDIRNLMRAIHSRFPRGRDLDENFQLAVLSEPFYRNKGAYVPIRLQADQGSLRAAEGGDPRGGQGEVPIGRAARPGRAHGRLLGVFPCRLPAGTLLSGSADDAQAGSDRLASRSRVIN